MKKIKNEKPNAEGKYFPDMSSDVEKHNITFWGFLKKYATFFVAFTAALIVLVAFIWKNVEDKKEKDIIIQNAITQLNETNQEMLKLMAKPMAWSIRADMLRGNMEQVDLLILDMVKEKNFQFIHIIAPNGNVILSTNKSLEDKLIANNVDASLLLVRSEIVVIQMNYVLFVTAPIFGIDKQIATLIIAYKPTMPVFGDKQLKK